MKSHSETLDGLLDFPVAFRVTSFPHDWQGSDFATDLLVITRLDHTHLGGGPKKLDVLTGGAIQASMQSHPHAGRLGEQHLVQPQSGPIKNLLVVGLGDVADGGRRTTCGLFQEILERAIQVGARKVSIPFFPGHLLDDNLKGSLAVLKCRANQCFHGMNGAGELAEIEILCAPQARRFVLEGLAVKDPLCQVCSHPRLPVVGKE